jgi:hypothetical protein
MARGGVKNARLTRLRTAAFRGAVRRSSSSGMGLRGFARLTQLIFKNVCSCHPPRKWTGSRTAPVSLKEVYKRAVQPVRIPAGPCAAWVCAETRYRALPCAAVRCRAPGSGWCGKATADDN